MMKKLRGNNELSLFPGIAISKVFVKSGMNVASGRLLMFIIFIACLAGITADAQQITPQAEQRARDLVSRMTLKEKIDYISGYTSFSLRAIPRLGIPEIKLADGPQGIRNHSPKSTLYPSGILSAATWNRDLLYKLGRGLGQDAKARGVNILLGPGVNIYRAPLCGRNYEYMGEDPYLAGEAAKQYILGVQSEGVIATIKHFAANNQEWSRHHASSDIDERTLHEIYFPVFRKAVQEANVGAVMNSYNLLNGVHTTEHKWLNIDILRNLWGFKGILMSDWTSVYSAVGAANGGLDLEMPKGRFMNPENLLPAIQNGTVTEETINLKVQHILQTLIAYGMLDKEQKDSSIPLDNPFSRQIALELAREGIVLLKNEDNLLPLKGKTAVMGPNANLIPTGGGSGFVTPFSTISVSQGLNYLKKNVVMLTDDVIYENIVSEFYTDNTRQSKGFKAEYFKNKTLSGAPAVTRTEPSIDYDWEYGAPLEGFPTDGFSIRWTASYISPTDGQLKIHLGGDDGYRLFVNDQHITGDWGNHSYSSREVEMPVEAGKEYRFRIEFFDNISSAIIRFGAYKLNEETLRKGLAKVDNVVFCTGFNSNTEGEGFDRPFALLRYQELFIQKIASMHPNLIVVLNAGGGVDFTAWHDAAKAILLAWYPGQEGGQAIAEILTGKISPSGKLPISIERKWEDNPVYNSYYENLKAEIKRVDYSEGVFVGYRGYDRSGKEPFYPFGYGLSYSTFDYSNLTVEKTGEYEVTVSFDVKNTGRMDASEVAQVYVRDVESSVPRPLKELKGYEKVFLKKGETKRVTIVLDKDAFSYYDMNRHQFVVEKGAFEILAGPASNSLPLKAKVMIRENDKASF